mgnify:CR=1 FL=1
MKPGGWSGNQAARLRLAVLERDHGVCWICGRPGADTADHLVPRSRGGSNALCNLAAAHARCNYARGNRTPAVPIPSRAW